MYNRNNNEKMRKPTKTVFVDYHQPGPNFDRTVHSWYTYLLLIGFYICYLLVGAFIFQYFEEDYEVSFFISRHNGTKKNDHLVGFVVLNENWSSK